MDGAAPLLKSKNHPLYGDNAVVLIKGYAPGGYQSGSHGIVSDNNSQAESEVSSSLTSGLIALDPSYRLYARRWYILFAFTLLSFEQ